MDEGENDHWHASISKDCFIAAFVKDGCANRKFELSVLVMRFHLWYLLSSGVLSILVALCIFSFGTPPPLHCSVPYTPEFLLEWNGLLRLDFIADRAEEVCIRILYRLWRATWLIPVVSGKSHQHHCPPPSTKHGSPGHSVQQCLSVTHVFRWVHGVQST